VAKWKFLLNFTGLFPMKTVFLSNKYKSMTTKVKNSMKKAGFFSTVLWRMEQNDGRLLVPFQIPKPIIVQVHYQELVTDVN